MNPNMFSTLLAANSGIFPIREVAYCILGFMVCIMGYFIIMPIVRKEPMKKWLPFVLKLTAYIAATYLIILMSGDGCVGNFR